MIAASDSIRSGMAATIAACGLLLPAAEAGEKSVRLSFMSYPAQKKTQSFQLQTGETSTLEVHAANQYISDPHAVAPMAEWSLGLFRQRGGRDKEFVPLASCKSLESSQQLLVVGHPINPDDEYKVTAVNSDPDYFKYGSFLFLNLSGLKLSVKVNDEAFEIEPGKHVVNAPEIFGDDSYIQAQVSVDQDGKKKKILNSRWPAHRLYRSLIIFYKGENDRILMHTIRQPSPDDGNS